MTYKKPFYLYKNLIFLQDGSSIKIQKLHKLKSIRLLTNNQNRVNLLEISSKTDPSLKSSSIFLKKYSF